VITSLIRRQLIFFWGAALVAIVVLAMVFLRLPEALNIGRYEVRAEFALGAGLYEGAQVNYLGHPVGRVAAMRVTEDGVDVRLKLSDDVAIPSGSTAEIHSMSAVGEQYVELAPPAGGAGGRTLRSGDVIPRDRTSYPVEIGPVLDNVHALVEDLPRRDLNTVLDETSAALSGRQGDLAAILDGGKTFIDAASQSFDPTRKLIEDTQPLLETVNGTSANIVSFSNKLASVTDQLRAGDADLRALLEGGPGFASQTGKLLDDLEPRLPGLLKPLNDVSNVLRLYGANIAQLLSDYPVALAIVQSVNAEFGAENEIALTVANVSNPGECLNGFLPVSQWRLPQDTGLVAPKLVWCAEPSGDPRVYKGARNVPCAENPARRAALVSQCRK